ncbi:hypothetical protein [Mycolicibacter kumamotonensis]|uniref:hypothetical protein n=1 Tax=Mycolicibacter kumamotonensis TaxID=354243 RepID=UPI001F43C259|nr:hypothetical protein [Mycolicibacter kumamotonensis]
MTTLISFGFSFWTARSGNQRQLRERLRKQLREMNLACLIYFQREGWEAVDRSPKFSFQALDQIHEDGLISPSHSHLERLKAILRDIRGRAQTQLPRDALGIELHAELTANNEARHRIAFKTLDADSQKYLRALGKMDNAGVGGYWTYLRYRFIPAREYIN